MILAKLKQQHSRQIKLKAVSIGLASVLLCSAVNSYGANLLDPANGAQLTLINGEANNTTNAAANLLDNDPSTIWRSPNYQYNNNFNFSFEAGSPTRCFDAFSLLNVTDSRAIETFMLLTTDDTSLSTDQGTTGWIPVIADPGPTGLLNYLHWGQGGRLQSGVGSFPDRLNDGSPGTRWQSSNYVYDSQISFAFDADWNGATGDAHDISQIFLYNEGNSTGVEKFQVEVKTLANPVWTPLIADPAPIGDFNFLQSTEGGLITASSGVNPQFIHDATPGTRWQSSNYVYESLLDFNFDTNGNGITGSAGDAADLFTLRQINLYNEGNSTGVEKFQIEVKTVSNPVWTKLVADPAPVGDFNFLQSTEGGVISASSGVNPQFIHDGTPGTRWQSSNYVYESLLDFNFDTNGDGTSGAAGDAADLFTLRQINLYNEGNSTGVEKFQIEVKTVSNPVWTKLVADPAPVGDFNFLQSTEGGVISASSGVNPQFIHDGTPGTRWQSSNYVYESLLDFNFDTNGDGTSGAAGDAADLFTLRQINLYNEGNSTGVEKFQIEVKTVSNPVWTKLVADPAPVGDFNFLQGSEGGLLTVAPGVNPQFIHDGTPGTRWQSSNYVYESLLDFNFDTNGDGTSGAAGDAADLFTLRQINLYNEGNSTGVEKFQIEVQTVSNPVWTKLVADPAPVGDFNFLQSTEGGLITASSGVNPQFIHDGSPGTRWQSPNYVTDNQLDFSFDTNGNGITSAAGDAADLFTLRQINLYNEGNSTGVQDFQVEVQTQANPVWTLVSFSGNTTLTAAQNYNLQTFVVDTPIANVMAIRLHTLTNYGNTVTRIHEFEAVGDAVGPSHTFIALQNYSKQSYVLASSLVDVTAIRLRTLDNYGNTVTRIHELEAIGDATGPTHTFIAQQNYNKQSYVLPSAVVDLTDIRLRTLDNYGNTVTRIHELEAIGDATGPSHTFIALQNYNKQSYVLDSVVSDLTDIRLRTLDNYGNTVTRIHELEAIGDATGPSHTFIAQQNYSRQTFVLSALVSNVTDIKLRTLDNYGNTVTRIHEFGAEAIADGPSYVFSALQSNALQNYTFADSSARIFRFKVFDNFGNTQTIARDISLNSTLCLAGKWDMDELSWNGSAGEVIDSSGSNHNGTAINGALTKNVASAVPGSPGTCGYGSFDGINDYVALPNFPDLTESFTISAWIKPHVINKDQRIYVDDENNSGGFAFSLGDGGNGRLRFFSRQVSPVSIDTQSAVIPLADQWYFVTAVHDSINKTRQIFVNGQPQQLTSGSTVSVYSGTWGSDPGMASIGGETNNAGSEAVPNWRFDGDIDEVRIYHQALTQTEIQAVMADTHPCISLLDHFQIQHDGQGISCAAEPVSVAAHAIDHSVVSSYAGSILLNTNSGKGSWNLVSGNGTFVDTTANDGLANYSFDASDNGVAQFSLDYTEGASPINISVSDSGIVDDDTEGLLSFAPSGFVITASPLANPPPSPVNDPLPAQTAGSNFNFSITAFGQTPANPQCGVIESYTGIKPVNFWSNYSNPTTGTLTPTINTQSIAATEVASTPQNITFNNGQAQVTAKYKDVGAIQIALKDADLSAHSNIIQGASNNFVVKPADFVTTVTGNPAAASASGAVFKKAGESFQLQVDVLDAEGDRTPNYGNETVAETLRVKSSQLMAPVGGRNGVDGAGTLANNSAFVAVVPGQFENTTTSFSEVGIIRLQTEVGDGDYLGAGNITGTETANVGRFIPDRFQISSNNPSFRNGDSSWGCGFSYQSQPFEFATGLNPQLTLTALSETGTPTFNYAASFWKLSTSLSNRDYVNQLAGVSAVLTADKTSASVSLTGTNDFSDGQGLLTISGDQLSYVKAAAIPTANDAPFDADVKLSIPVSDLTDSDGVCVDADNDGICEAYNSTNISGTQLRWGRWFVENVLGSELENLDLLATAEYFDGSMFQLNSADSCSATISGWISPTLTAYTDNLAPGETLLTQSVMSSGLLPFVLSAPGEGNDGSLLFTLPTPAWMFYDYDGNGTADGASATVTFGVYKGKKPVIYWRQKFGN